MVIADAKTRLLHKLVEERIVLLDGAMGTMIQDYHLEENDYRGTIFKEHPIDLKGNNDILCLSRPDIIKEIHCKYLNAGSDIIGTNTFNATSIAQADYKLENQVAAINYQAARIAQEAVREIGDKMPNRQCFVAGCMGPTSKTASMSPKVSDPAYRAVSFDDLSAAYYEQAKALVAGGVDILLPETVFDTLNLKAALAAIDALFSELGYRLPIMISVTITDRSGRTLSGQTVEAFWNTIRHAKPFSVGINCALGAQQMRPYIEELSRIADCFISCYPNAGLPNPLSPSGYNETPDETGSFMKEFGESALVNLVGGCCGTTPDHIHAIYQAVKNLPPRITSVEAPATRLSGLEALNIQDQDAPFILIGERTNIMGSPKFRQHVLENNWEAALAIARKQIESGANVIDICFDEGLLDGKASMAYFLNLIASEPEISRVPLMLDSSKWEILEAGIKCVQGKPIVNSISLKEGEAPFLQQAKALMRYGAALIVIAFDEQGQADTEDRKVAICERAYRLLTENLGMDPHDIIFDPAVLTVGTGIEEHATYGIDFINALRRIKKSCPHARTSGGISNISFAFRGNNAVREAMNSSFLYHAIKAGLDMGIVNAGMLDVYEEIDKELLAYVEDVLLNRRQDATDRLIEYAQQLQTPEKKRNKSDDNRWRLEPVNIRIRQALIKGITDHIEIDIAESLNELKSPLAVIEGPLMEGMKAVGALFGEGKMFLPQVVKTARVMKKAVGYLTAHFEEDKIKSSSRGKFLIATVKGDVHDIGKNIVSVVLACNGYDVTDLGVMTPMDKIMSKAEEIGADIIGLSGLITPSLDEMRENAAEMQRRGFKIPLLIGGATTSKAHTAIKIATEYNGPVVQVADASRVIEVCNDLLSPSGKDAFIEKLTSDQAKMRENYHTSLNQFVTIEVARENSFKSDWQAIEIARPEKLGVFVEESLSLFELRNYIDWSPFFWVWQLKDKFPQILKSPKYGREASELYEDANRILDKIVSEKLFLPRAVTGLFAANRVRDDVELYDGESRGKVIKTLRFLRQQRKKEGQNVFLSLADFVAPREEERLDYVGGFVCTIANVDQHAKTFCDQNDDYSAIITKSLGDRLAEALAEYLHQRIRQRWGYGNSEKLTINEMIGEKYRGIRPAPGYPACPDHTEKRCIWDLLQADIHTGAYLTENFAMHPASSISGLYFSHPDAKYFNLGKICEDQFDDYAMRKAWDKDEAKKWLLHSLR